MVNPDELPLFVVPTTEHEVFFGATKLGIHVIEVQHLLSIISLEVHADVTTSTRSRYFRVTVSSNIANELQGQGSHEKGSTIIIWNARNIHRPSFAENFRKLHERFSLMLVVMIEARSKWPFLETVKKDVGLNYMFESISPPSGVGGVALAWDDRVEPYFLHRQALLYGHVLSVNTIPSFKVSRGAPLVIPEGKHYLAESDCSDDELYDVMAAWYTNSGLDEDPSIHDWLF
ncbi:uncharacterized protein LOC110682730 [Chenopodium quinoa]|uniref:uncharacterized protein LOC110682730 n=1 Tax=Chenopodium quinoa TaxID=63459 RepID=UPI000B77AD7E|nr:uncharacterized protein LOC110682730 [Chenopodium quinoa]